MSVFRLIGTEGNSAPIHSFWGFLFLCFCESHLFASERQNPFLGKWEYRQASLPGEYDSEGEIIEFQALNGVVSGVYHGLEREGEHGLFYSLVDIDSLAIREEGKISFIVPGRTFYAKRPMTKSDLEKAELQSSGNSKGTLKFAGGLAGDKLVLDCASDLGECPENKMVFRRGKWPESKPLPF